MVKDSQRGSRPGGGGDGAEEKGPASGGGLAPSGEKAASSEKTSIEIAEEKIAQLETKLRARSDEAAANFDRYLRAVADADNLKKRTQREKADAIRLGNEILLRDLLPVLDNLERAVEHADLGGNGQSVVEGVQLTLRLFRDLLERHGVKEITAPEGTTFDPSIHEAVASEPHPDFPPNTVIRQQQKGYQLNDRLLRPARVAVSGPRVEEQNPPEDSGD